MVHHGPGPARIPAAPAVLGLRGRDKLCLGTCGLWAGLCRHHHQRRHLKVLLALWPPKPLFTIGPGAPCVFCNTAVTARVCDMVCVCQCVTICATVTSHAARCACLHSLVIGFRTWLGLVLHYFCRSGIVFASIISIQLSRTLDDAS